MEHSVLVIKAIVQNNLHFEKSWAAIQADPYLLNCVRLKSDFRRIYNDVCDLVYKVYIQFPGESLCGL